MAFQDNRPDLNAILRRHHLANPARIRHASHQTPVHYLLFDLLFLRGQSLLQETLSHRRSLLHDVLAEINAPQLLFSDGVTQFGRAFFEQVVAKGHEGVMAKLRSSRYAPGKRSAAWKKIKPMRIVPCVIIGYRPSREGVHSVLVASVDDGVLRYVGRVSSGFSEQTKYDLLGHLSQRQRPTPIVACSHKAVWVEPELFCRVRFLQWSPGGRLRGACFTGLLDKQI